MSAVTRGKRHFVDRKVVMTNLEELIGLSALLLDAQRHGEVSQTGVYAAARYMETIHDRLVDAFEVEGDQ